MKESNYLQKLKDPRWQKKRLEIFERDNWQCQCCHDDENMLNVHHKRYPPNTEPWDCPNEFLITLCQDCHEAETKERPEFERYLLDALAKLFLAGDLLSLTTGFNKMSLLHVPEVVASVYEWALSDPDIQAELIDRYFKHLKETLRKDKV